MRYDFETEDFVVQAAYTTKLHNTQSNQAGKVYEEYATSLDANSPPPAVFQPVARVDIVPTQCVTGDITHTLKAEGFDASEDGTVRGQTIVPVAQPIAFHPTQDPINSTDGSTHAMGTGSAGGCATVAVAVALRGREGGATAELGDEVQNCLRASQGGGDKPHVLAPVAVAFGGDIARTLQARHDSSPCADRGMDVVATSMAVRRLTPVECERLQGFPDNYTNIPWNAAKEAARKGISYEAVLAMRSMTLRGPNLEECPDGPRYKALGNSWAVPVVRWIGSRINKAIK
jgi:DNA (cytosine-5)-methyltransferase 1